MEEEKGLHYGWVIVFTGTLIIVACLGLARFAFGMLLPSMSSALHMSYDQMGLLGTANFAGYLTAVGVAPFLLRRLSPRKLISGGLSNIPLMVLVSYWFSKEKRGQAAGFIVIGSGFAIMLSGVLIPYLNKIYGADGWRASWFIIGIIVFIIFVIATLLIRNTPEEKGLQPYGKAYGADVIAVATNRQLSSFWVLTHLGMLYFVFGATYVVYGTFIVTTMVQEYGMAEASAGHLWSWIGFFSLFSGVVFGILSDKAGRKMGLIAVFSVQTVAYLLVGLNIGAEIIFLSIALYGLAAFAIPAIMAAAIGDYLGKARAAAGFSIITFFFAVGQTVGPFLAGVLAESMGTFKLGYLVSGCMTLFAIVLAYFLPKPTGH